MKFFQKNFFSVICRCSITATVVLFESASAAWFADTMMDPLDGKLDASKYLAEKKGFLPVPVIITEPAVGYGLGVAALFFHDPLAGKTDAGKEFDPNPNQDGSLKPPSVSALFGGYTENGTWFGGGAHYGVWRDDTVRYLGVLAKANVNMKFYGIDGSRAIRFNTQATYLLQELMFRVAESNLFAGFEYSYLDTRNEFDSSDFIAGEELPGIRFPSISAGLGLILKYEGLNNSITPSKGLKAELSANNYGEKWGGDSNFNKYRLYANYWIPIKSDWVLGLRGDGSAITDTPPFYEYPFISLRGIPAMRYQAEKVLVGETELQYSFNLRWSVLGFLGAGKTYKNLSGNNNETVVSKGLGFRYLVARRFGMRTGVDIAWGPEDTAFYIQLGSAWGR